jgi:hypothetical protein
MVDSTRIIGDKQFQKAWVISYFPWRTKETSETPIEYCYLYNVFLIVG